LGRSADQLARLQPAADHGGRARATGICLLDFASPDLDALRSLLVPTILSLRLFLPRSYHIRKGKFEAMNSMPDQPHRSRFGAFGNLCLSFLLGCGLLAESSGLAFAQSVNLDIRETGIFISGTNTPATLSSPVPRIRSNNPTFGMVNLVAFNMFATAAGFSSPEAVMTLALDTERHHHYRSELLENIDIIFTGHEGPAPPQESGFNRQIIYFVQLTQISSGTTYFFLLDHFVSSRQDALDEFRVRTIADTRILLDHLSRGTDGLRGYAMRQFEANSSEVGAITVFTGNSADGIPYPAPRFHLERLPVFEQLLATAENNQRAGRETFGASLDDDTFVRLVTPYLSRQIVGTVCGYWSSVDAMIPVFRNLGGGVFMREGQCVAESLFGRITFVVHSTQRTGCVGAICTFTTVLDCSSMGAPVMQACGEFKDDMARQYPDGIHGEAVFDTFGRIDRVTTDFAMGAQQRRTAPEANHNPGTERLRKRRI